MIESLVILHNPSDQCKMVQLVLPQGPVIALAPLPVRFGRILESVLAQQGFPFRPIEHNGWTDPDVIGEGYSVPGMSFAWLHDQVISVPIDPRYGSLDYRLSASVEHLALVEPLISPYEIRQLPKEAKSPMVTSKRQDLVWIATNGSSVESYQR